MAGGSGKPRPGAALEWIAGTVGLILTLALLGFIGYKKIQQVKPPERAIEQAREIPTAFKRS